MPSVIALDAMGSDKAPKPEIEGALQAARHHGVRVLLVGPAPRLKAELARYPGARRLPVEVVHASEVITMDDKVEAIRGKRDSSIRAGLRLVREGRPRGFVTEGVDARFWLIQAFNGISYGALLFLVGSGLSLIFGVMRIVNLSHGSYFLLGGYVALSVIWTTGSWLLAIPVAAVTVALIGLVMERVFLRPLGFDPLRQVLLTVGFAFLFQQAALDIWTGNPFDINPPAALGGVIGGAFLGVYPGLDFEMLPIAFAVVIIGGMGSLGGAAIGALIVGLADNFGKALFPEISYFTLYAPMALILAVKPTGLFGRE